MPLGWTAVAEAVLRSLRAPAVWGVTSVCPVLAVSFLLLVSLEYRFTVLRQLSAADTNQR